MTKSNDSDLKADGAIEDAAKSPNGIVDSSILPVASLALERDEVFA